MECYKTAIRHASQILARKLHNEGVERLPFEIARHIADIVSEDGTLTEGGLYEAILSAVRSPVQYERLKKTMVRDN